MGCIIGSLASSAACCFCGSAASLCCSCLPGCKSSTSSRIMYGLMLFVGTLLSCICLAPGLRGTLSKIPALCDPLKINIIDTGIKSGLNCDLVVGFGAVYRIIFGLACFFFIFCILMIRVHKSTDFRARIQNGFWGIKFLLFFGIVIGAFFIPADSQFNEIWMYFGLIGGFIFIFIQLVLLIDFAHGWNQSWIEAYDEDGNRSFCFGLVFFTIFFYISAFVGIVCLYIFYGHSGCGLNQFFISFNMIVCILLSIVSVLPAVQERLPYSGLLQSSLLTAYITYMTWSSMNNEPDTNCNPFLSVKNITIAPSSSSPITTNTNSVTATSAVLSFDSHTVIGIVIFFLTVLYSSIRNSGNTSFGKLTMDGSENTAMSDKGDGSHAHVENGGQAVWDDEEEGVAYDYSMFHAMFLFASLYIMMTLTSWFAPQSSDLTTLYANWASTWIKMVSTWLCMAVYLWTLVAPLILRDRDFG